MEHLEFKGTTGEWKLINEVGREEVFLGDFKGEVQFWHHHGDTMTKKEALANAKLFHASRDLLEALQWYLRNGENTHSRKLAEKAIEKALK